MTKRKTLEEFRIEGNTIIPHSVEDRAEVKPFGNSSKSCPYNIPRLKQTYVFNKEKIEIIKRQLDANYCWDSCNIIDCPAYIKNKK